MEISVFYTRSCRSQTLVGRFFSARLVSMPCSRYEIRLNNAVKGRMENDDRLFI
jgi:hypothetical protein